MSDDTHTRTRVWPPGPFLTFPDTTGTEQPKAAEPDEPDSRAETAADTGTVEKAPNKPEIAGQKAAPEDTGTDTPEPKKWDPEFWRKRPGEKTDTVAPDASQPKISPEIADLIKDAEGPVVFVTQPHGGPQPTDAAKEAPADEDKDTQGFVDRVKRQIQLMREDEQVRHRRLLAAKYGTGAAIGWAVGADDYATNMLVYAHNSPSDAASWIATFAGAFGAWKLLGKLQHILQPGFAAVGQLFSGFGRILSVVPVVGHLTDFVDNAWNAIFGNYVPFRVLATAVGGYFALPWGYALVGYLQSKGLDMTYWMPHLVGITATTTSWYLIDRRTEAYAHTPQGHIFHWATCAVTGTLGVAELLFMTP
jgi:hypothetical protein